MELQDNLALEQEKNQALEAALLEKEDIIAALEAHLADAKKGSGLSVVSALPKFKVGKDEYQFICGGFNHGGIDYTATEAAKDKNLCKELVEGEYGVITKL